jgi:probable phosphoglycerate mutase
VKARLSTDGGARGNPGPAAYGYVLEAEDGTVLAAHGEAIGVATNKP